MSKRNQNANDGNYGEKFEDGEDSVFHLNIAYQKLYLLSLLCSP